MEQRSLVQLTNKNGTKVEVSDKNELLVSEVILPGTPGVLDITNTAGSTLEAWKSFTFVCVAGTVTIDGEVFPIGTYTFSNNNGTLNSMSYDASTSTDCKIIFIA